MFLDNLKRIREIFLDTRCILCDSKDLSEKIRIICKKCFNSFNITFDNICPICGHPLKNEGCPSCNKDNPIYFDSYQFIQYYSGFFQTALKKLKLNGQFAIIKLFFELLKYKGILNKNIPITIVPDTKFKRFKKGRSSLYYLLRLLKRDKFIVYKDIYKKNFKFTPQKMKNKLKREDEIQSLFYLPSENKNKYSGEIYLIDDIFTTGSTINYGSRLLKEAGFTKIRAVTFFRALLEADLI